jgi:hypothetical protein
MQLAARAHAHTHARPHGARAHAHAAAEEAGSDEGYHLQSFAAAHARTVLGALEQGELSALELGWLVRATTMSGGTDWAEGVADTRDYDMRARVFAVDGSGHVDIKHVYHNKAL